MKILAQHGGFSCSDLEKEEELGFTLFEKADIAQTSLVLLTALSLQEPVLCLKFKETEIGRASFLAVQGLFSHSRAEQNRQNFEVMRAGKNKAWKHRFSPRETAHYLALPNEGIEWVATDRQCIYIRARNFETGFPIVIKKLFLAGFFEPKTFYNFSFQLDYAGFPQARKKFADIYGELASFFRKGSERERPRQLTPNPT